MTIVDKDELFRRISPPWREYYRENSRLSSATFQPPKGKNLSVDVARLTTIELCLRGYPECGLASLITDFVRSLHLDVIHSPTEKNPAHTDIIGSLTKSIRRKLADSANILVE